MMMVPRSFALQKRQSRDEIRVDEKGISVGIGLSIPRPRSAPVVATPKKVYKQQDRTIRNDKDKDGSRQTMPTTTASDPVSTPSKPVVIPPRSPSKGRTPTSYPHQELQQPRRVSQHADDRHVSRAVPASVAALLAVTSIPPPNPHASQLRRTNGTKGFQKTSIDELIQGWREDEATSLSVSPASKSPMSILLERSEEPEQDYASEISPSFIESSDMERSCSMTSRSVSSESIPSVPDLMLEDRSPPSWGSPRTPSIKARKANIDKITSPTEECPLDHPLLPPPDLDDAGVSIFESPDFKASIRPSRFKALPPTPSKSTFKSNLTASINALASSLRSFSNFTAPSIPPDDLLTRSLFSPTLPQRFTSEMRPKSSDGVPDPALRRYLNPTPGPERLRQQQHGRRMSLEERDRDLIAGLSVRHSEPDFAAAVNASSSFAAAPLADADARGPLIQMQTYGVKARGRNKKLPPLPSPARDSSSEAGRIAKAGGASLRQREPRENSDFLRVIVLEMNMRRVGKLDAKGLSRAKVWLPPRKGVPMSLHGKDVDEEEGASSTTGEKRVPARWVAVSADDY